MSQSVELKAVVVETPVVVKKPVLVKKPVVRKIKIKAAPVVAAEADPKVGEPVAEKPKAVAPCKPVELEEPMNESIWMHMRRIPKEKPAPFVWENVEDISDDENDTPQAAGKRLSMMKATRDQMQRRAYENKLAALQGAGLFLKWSKPKLLETHENYDYVVQSTYAYPIRV